MKNLVHTLQEPPASECAVKQEELCPEERGTPPPVCALEADFAIDRTAPDVFQQLIKTADRRGATFVLDLVVRAT